MTTRWFYAKNGQKVGPVLFDELRRLVQSGKLGRTDMLLPEGSGQWVPVQTVLGQVQAILEQPTKLVQETQPQQGHRTAWRGTSVDLEITLPANDDLIPKPPQTELVAPKAAPKQGLPAAEERLGDGRKQWATRRRLWLCLAGGGILGLGALVAAIVLFWQTPHGTVRIECDDPSVEIVFDKTGPTIRGADREPITLRAGEHGVLVKRGDFTFEADRILIEKGKTITLKVEWLPGEVQLLQDGKVIAARDMPLPPTFNNGFGMEFVLVPKGKAWLGGAGGKVGDKEVEIAHAFYLGKYEVTQEEWQKVTGVNPSHFSRGGGGKNAVKDVPDAELKRFPVEMVSWWDAQAFLAQLNELDKQVGWVYRLPKEVEWEYACRGGPLPKKEDYGFDYYFDRPTNTLPPDRANFNLGLNRTCKVGSYLPNRLGLYDMHGNVHEWCADKAGASQRRLRGGGWNSVYLGDSRAGGRYADEPSHRVFHLGLRVARVAVGKAPVAPPPPEEKRTAATPPTFRNSLGMKLVLVPAGKFLMGSPQNEEGRQGDEQQHEVQITRAFYFYCNRFQLET